MRAPWVIVLATCEGQRRGSVERWLGVERPRQFCSVIGARTMVQHALERAASITDVERIVTVIGPGHRADLEQAVSPGSLGPVLEQPLDRGSSAAVYMALAHVLLADPHAVVLVLPATQFASPENTFVHHLADACALADRQPGRVVLLGAIPRHPECELGWIIPAAGQEPWTANGNGQEAVPVARLSRTPPRKGSARRLRHGAMWNTQIFAARGAALWNLGERLTPGVMESFATVALAMKRGNNGRIPPETQEDLIRFAYSEMTSTDIGNAVLRRATAQALVLRLEGVLWADWSRPEWVMETLCRMDRIPDEVAAAARRELLPGSGLAARAPEGPVLTDSI